MRTTLGESLKSIQAFDVPIEQATTPSLTALKAYALGLEERRRGREIESIAFFNQAIELDPEFAAAYVMLSTVYGSLGEWRQSEAYAKLAYQRRGRVSKGRGRKFGKHQELVQECGLHAALQGPRPAVGPCRNARKHARRQPAQARQHAAARQEGNRQARQRHV